MDYTTSNLVASVKTRALIPTSQSTFSDANLIQLANEELQGNVVPFIMKFRSEYFVTPYELDILPQVANYPIPTRSIGGKIRNVTLKDTMQNEYDLPQIEREERRFYNPQNSGTAPNNYCFYFEGNNIVLLPKAAIGPGGTLAIGIYKRPGNLVAATDCGQVQSIDTVNNTVTVTSLPSTMLVGTLVDFVSNAPGFDNPALDAEILAVNATTLTFSSVPDTLQIGDWVCLSQESPIPQIPLELQTMLIQRVVVKVLEALNDHEALKVAQSKLQELEASAEHLLSPRSDGNPKKLINRYSTLRSWGSRRFTNY